MIISVFKFGVRKTDKRARRELWGSQEHNKEQIPNNSHGIQRKRPFTDATKESFEFEISFKWWIFFIWWRWSHGAWGGLQESTDGWNQTKHRPSPTQPLLFLLCTKAGQTLQGGEQEAAGGAEINEKAQNEKEQQLETLVMTSGTEPETTTLLSHLLQIIIKW